MNDLPKLYFTMETYLFPLLEEELCELTAKMKEFLRIVEMIKPSRFITSTLRWSGIGTADERPGENASGIFLESGL
ncbi:MAG: hypothetical protein L6W00_18410 [Lentisphaeria bacterium]|nr:MAG: hypothetical protein L6W00_18410 [Lentisphaeria bacterium]